MVSAFPFNNLSIAGQVRSAAVDHGADIGAFSQYPGEHEYLWNPLSLVEPLGIPLVENTTAGLVTIIPVRMNMNVKSMTVDELEDQKKAMHLSSFKFLIKELEREFKSWDDKILERMKTDCEVENAMRGEFLSKFQQETLRQCEQVYEYQQKKQNKDFINAEIFRSLVIGMLDCNMFARSKVLSYLKDPTSNLKDIRKSELRSAHRRYVSFLERSYHEKVSSVSTGQQTEGWAIIQKEAWQLCKVKGLLTSDMPDHDTENGGSSGRSLPKGSNALEVVLDGQVTEPRIVSAAQEDLSSGSLRLLVAARANIDAVDAQGNTAIMRASYVGNSSALNTLHQLGGELSKARKDGYTAMHVAAQEGHAICIKELHQLGLNPAIATKQGINIGFTPLMAAAKSGHARCVEQLAKLISLEPGINMKSIINAEDAAKMTALLYAAKYNHADCISILSRFHATIDYKALVLARHFGNEITSGNQCYDTIKKLVQLAWSPKIGEKVQVLIEGSPYAGVVTAEDETMSPFYVEFDGDVESDGWYKREDIVRRSTHDETSVKEGSKVMMSADYYQKMDEYLKSMDEKHSSLRDSIGEVKEVYTSSSNFLRLYRVEFSFERNQGLLTRSSNLTSYGGWYSFDELQAPWGIM
jgi:ankyrin repeat protein